MEDHLGVIAEAGEHGDHRGDVVPAEAAVPPCGKWGVTGLWGTWLRRGADDPTRM